MQIHYYLLSHIRQCQAEKEEGGREIERDVFYVSCM